MNAFRYYVPDEAAIAKSKSNTEQTDARLNKLEKRFGHPALHAELYTPMVHASMVNLLPQVYHGRLSEERTKLDEYGGQKVNAALIGGLKIAGIDSVSRIHMHSITTIIVLTARNFRTISRMTWRSISATEESKTGTLEAYRQRTCCTKPHHQQTKPNTSMRAVFHNL